MCVRCSKRVSPTAGTVFDHTHTPLTVWFAAAWQLTSQKSGVSAAGLQRALELGSYQTAWAMLHRLRAAMVRPGRDRLSGVVEMDETLLGGVTPGKRGRTPGAKVLVGVGAERREPKGFGRCRLAVLPDASTSSLSAFLADHVEPGSTVVTDGWPPYGPALKGSYTHDRHVAPGDLAHKLLPGVHRVASLLDRWLLGTHQGGVRPEHLPAYLEEFTFRFNRRHARNRGLVFWRLVSSLCEAPPLPRAELAERRAPQKAADEEHDRLVDRWRASQTAATRRRRYQTKAEEAGREVRPYGPRSAHLGHVRDPIQRRTGRQPAELLFYAFA